MPRPIAITYAFTSGELSPGAYGRTDIAKYSSGLTCCRNYLPTPLGGIERRAGTTFVCETKFSQFNSRLKAVEPNANAAYMLESGCQYLRFYKNGGVVTAAAELIANGGFDADLASWTTTASGTTSITWHATQRARFLSAGSGSGSLRQSVTVTSGRTYTISFTIDNGASFARTALLVGSSNDASDILSTGSLASGSYTYDVVATSTTLSVRFLYTAPSSPNTNYVDTVSATEQVPMEVTTPYDYTQVSALDTVQSADEVYWLHQCHITRKLSRYGDTCWRFNCVIWAPPPSVEYGARGEFEVTPSATTGTAINLTAANTAAAFLASDKDREIQVFSGANAGARAGIVSVTSATVVVAYVCVPFLTTGTNCRGTFKISGSPMTTVTPTDNAPVGKSSNLTLTAAGWRQGGSAQGETDVGKFVLLNGGCYEITCVSSTTVARSIMRSVATGLTAGEAGAWTLEESLWSCVRGYAQTGDFKDDRLVLDAGFRFCGSKSGDYENFAGGANDDDAIVFGINSKTINTIRAIVGARDLQLFTTGAQFIATHSSNSAAITPTDVSVSQETAHTSGGVPPLRVNDVTLFLTRYGKQLREFTVPRDSIGDAYVAPDLLLLAEHITEDTAIVDMAYQREPTSAIWCVLDNGLLASCTYRREENVVAWATHQTCGSFEAVAVIPHPDGDRDQVWVIVKRSLTSGTKRYVEYLDDSMLVYDRRFTDAAVVYNNCVPVTIFTGLDHLECERVNIQADGAFVGTCVVAQGRVGIIIPANKVEIGLPMISEAITLQPDIAVGAGSIQPMTKRWTRVFMRVKDSCAMQVRTAGGQLEFIKDQRGIAMAGAGVKDYDIPRLGDFGDGRITFRQEQPLPSHVLMVGGVLDIGDA